MAIKHFCDRCGAEINPVASHAFCKLSKSAVDCGYTEPYEICVSCSFRLGKFLKGEAEIVLKDGDNDG